MQHFLPLSALLLWAAVGYAAREVIVIGAGASGLAAARKLTNEGGVKVTVLEARPDRYGGRIWTNRESFTNATGPEVEMGASFVHNPVPSNQVIQLLRDFKIPVVKMNDSAVLAVSEADGSRYSPQRVSDAWDHVFETIDAAVVYAKARGSDRPLLSSLQESKLDQRISSPLSQLIVAEVEFDYGATFDLISSTMFEVGYDDADDEDNNVPAQGYSQMLEMIVRGKASETPLDVHLGKEVTEVAVLSNKTVLVTCKDGSEYEADAVIVTLPLGVLKANVVRFKPELPLRKVNSIRRLGYGVINKVILEFDRVFWPEDEYHMYAVMKNSTQKGDLTLIANFVPTTRTPILMCFAVSDFGEESESMSDEELKTIALARLRTIFGSDVDSAKVVNMARSRWLADPFARGAYSYPAVGVMSDDWDRVGEPVKPLFFAGEHTRTAFYGTVQTALETGRRAATEAMEYMNHSSFATKIYPSHTIPLVALLLRWLL